MKKSKLGLLLLSSLALVAGGAIASISAARGNSAISIVKAESKAITFSEVAESKKWLNATSYTSLEISPFIFSVTGGGNNGKYYTSDSTWRFYNGGGLSISSNSNYIITSVTSNPSTTFLLDNGIATASFSATTKLKSITIVYSANVSLPEGFSDGLNEINPYFSLAYKYTSEETNEFEVDVNNGGCPSDSSTSLDKDKILSTTYSSDGTKYSQTTTLPNGVTIDTNTEKVYFSADNGYKLGSSGASGSLTFNSTYKINKLTLEAKAFKSTETQFAVNDISETAVENSYSLFEFEMDDVSSIKISSTARIYIKSIKFSFSDYTEFIYSDVDFRIRVAVDEMKTFVNTYTDVESYGVEVKTDSKTKEYKFDESTLTTLDNQMQFVVIDLGDAIKNPERFTESFTITPFACYSSAIKYSSKSKTKSIVDLVKDYHNMDEWADKVSGLYNYLINNNFIND